MISQSHQFWSVLVTFAVLTCITGLLLGQKVA